MIAALFAGYRSAPSAAAAALRDALLRVSVLATAVPEIAEHDLIPVKVLQLGEGVRIMEARIRIAR